MSATNRIAAWTALLALAALAGGCAPQESQPPQIPWIDGDKALGAEMARSMNKPLVVLYTGSDWCPPCIMLDEQVWSDESVRGYAGDFIWVRIEVPRAGGGQGFRLNEVSDAMRADGVRSVPTLLFYDPQGRLMGRTGGFSPPFAMTGTLESYSTAGSFVANE